ncbi:hypothetical protein CK203_025591 [Vitis vinifera]|uniref:Retrovirus-related Pol polyprotein from transposon TNT 1-94 n=1 Tax=Vitis vinifera TaxID=29760 RepID=A0A438IEQ8_VITVI|nr:hypothetical protein CK203_025591 [Vitis vinifera]
MESDDSSKWMETMNEELKSMVITVSGISSNCLIVVNPSAVNESLRQSATLKAISNDLKARLMAKGFTQKEELHQMDVKTAFLNGNLDEDIYMEQPEGDLGLLRETKEYLSKNFHMVDMGEANYVINIEIFRDRSRGVLGMLGRYQSDPGFEHWKAAKKVMSLKSTSGFVFMLANRAISWKSEKQSITGFIHDGGRVCCLF